MKLPPAHHQRGNVLILAIIVVMVISGFVAVALTGTSNAGRVTDRARNFSATQAAVEGALENAFATWRSAIRSNNGAVSTSEVAASLSAPTFPGMSYCDANGTITNSPVTSQVFYVDAVDAYGAPNTNAADPPAAVTKGVAGHPGWVGSRTFSYVAHARMKQTSGKYNYTVGLRRTLQYTEAPLFQAMYFFQDTIEFYRPAAMILGGLVHTNGKGYISSSSSGTLTFQGNVSYVDDYSETADPPYANQWSGWTPNAQLPPTYSDSKANQLSQVTPLEALGDDPSSLINTGDTNPNNDSMHELIEPPSTAIDPATGTIYEDPEAFATRRYYNKAGMLITINGSNVTVVGQNGVTLTASQQTAIKGTLGSRTQIYDQREGANVNVSSLDVAKLRTALTTAGITGFNGVLYVDDVTSTTSKNAIRLVNGGVLPDGGLTVATENGLYIQGDYNTGTVSSPTSVPANVGNANNTASPVVPGYNRQPSAVVADAVMLLSNAWSDSNANKTLSSRQATNTTYNTAILSGFMQSGYDPTPNNTGNGDNYGYSGGANNFARFLEDWGGNYCTYYGSMVELYTSKKFTGEWDTGVIFAPPYRRWNYDTKFNTTQPPGSLIVTSWSRGTWSKY